MPHSDRRLRLALGTAVLPLLSCLALACQSPGRTATAAGLADGPTRWLMLPEELRQVQRLRTNREAVDWLETFWRRRDPDPERPGNETARSFYQRVEAADRLYSDGGVRGSLTDRGRALILLGPPPVLRYSQKRAPAWEPGLPGSKPAIQTREVVLESWVYTMADLPSGLRERIAKEDPERSELLLVFLVEPRHTQLLEGEKLLDLAVRAAVRDGAVDRPRPERQLPRGQTIGGKTGFAPGSPLPGLFRRAPLRPVPAPGG